MADTAVTWLGHAAFRIDTPGGKRVYVDPWLENPNCPESEREPERVDLIALTHGHDDHLGQTIELAQRFGCPVIGLVELRDWLSDSGPAGGRRGGAETRAARSRRTASRSRFTDAKHSSSVFQNGTFVYLGEPAGLVIEVENGTKLYFAGDTCVFGDMALIGRIYEPDVAVLPIGGHFTMDPREAAVALELLGVGRVHPVPLRNVPAPRRDAGGVPRAADDRLRDRRARAGRARSPC